MTKLSVSGLVYDFLVSTGCYMNFNKDHHNFICIFVIDTSYFDAIAVDLEEEQEQIEEDFVRQLQEIIQKDIQYNPRNSAIKPRILQWCISKGYLEAYNIPSYKWIGPVFKEDE